MQQRGVLVVGLGHVGLSWASYLVSLGHKVSGVDLSTETIDLLKKKKLPFYEKGLAEVLFQSPDLFCVDSKMTSNLNYDAAFICTPIANEQDSEDLLKLIESVSEATKFIFIKSTLPLQGLEKLQSLVESLHSVGVHVSYLPEFFREGVANEDIRNGQIVVGAQSNLVLEQLALILGDRPLQVCRMGEAVVLKLASNAWHGLKVAFSNEVHQVCNGLGEMSDRVMELFCLDRRLNISDSYLQPGPPFGGYCLQKDIEFISRKHSGLPVIGGIVASNNDVIDRITTRLMSSGFKKIFWYGNSFKPGTDDSRNSISLTISDKLKAESIEVVFVEALPIQDVTQAEQTLLVLGPRELSDEDYEWIMLNQLNVFDLGYFAATRSNFKSYAKYESY